MLIVRRLSVVKMSVLPNFIYRFDAIPTKSQKMFLRYWQIDSEVYMGGQKNQNNLHGIEGIEQIQRTDITELQELL